MTRKPLMALLCAAILLTGCYATYPSKPKDQAAYHASEAAAHLSKGNLNTAVANIETALERPTGAAKVKELFESPQLC